MNLDKIDMLDPKLRISKAKLQLLRRTPFFGELVMTMKFIPSETAGVGTTCVDYQGNMYYHPQWIRGLKTLEDVMFEVAHEVMHLVQRCHERFPDGGNHKIWNTAADIKVDTILTKALGFQSQISKDNVTSAIMAKYKNKTTEQIYYHLLENPHDVSAFGECPYSNTEQGEGPTIIPGSQVGKRGCTSGAMHGNPGTSIDINKMKQYIRAAALAAQGRGDTYGIAEEFLVQLTTAKVRWTDFIRRLSRSCFRNKYTYSRPNRRSHTLRVTLPSRTKSPRGAIIAMDTSGSISDEFLCQATSECAGILRESQCSFLRIYFHDTKCYHVEDYTQHTINKIKVTREGTSHLDVFEKIIKEEPNVGLVIAFTDLVTTFPPKEPEFPVIWAHPKERASKSVPWGIKVEVELNHE